MSEFLFDIEEGDAVAPVLIPALPVEDLGELKYRLMREFDIDMLEGAAHAVGVRTEAEARNALSMALQARKLEKAIDESRAQIVKPHFDYQKAINKLVKDFKDKFNAIEKHLQGKIEAWMEEESNNPFAAVDKLQVEDGSISVKKFYDFVITDEKKVPDDFKSVDSALIEKAIKFGVRNIPGVEIIERKETTLRVKN